MPRCRVKLGFVNPGLAAPLSGAVLFTLTLASSAAAQTPGFWLIGFPPGWTHGSAVAGLSQDGTLAVGATYSQSLDVQPGYRWSAATGRMDFDYGPSSPRFSPPLAVDSSGTTVVGWASRNTFPSPENAYRKVGDGPFENLGLLPTRTRSQAKGVSGDGSIVVGFSDNYPNPNGFGEAFRWTSSTGMVGLGYARPGGTTSQAAGISRDGSTIVGYSQSGGGFGDVDAFRWTAAGGMQALPALPGAPLEAYASAASADGSVIVGRAINVSLRNRAVRWDASGIHDLGVLGNATSSAAYAVNDDGSVVGGTMVEGGTAFTAFVWTQSTGMTLLSDYLISRGVMPPAGYSLSELMAISGDGLTFGGHALNLTTNKREGFVATIPAPASMLMLTIGPLFVGPRRRLDPVPFA